MGVTGCLRLTSADRGLWVVLSRTWARWSDALIIVKPAKMAPFPAPVERRN
jgi:hypothetical protein